MRQEEAHDACHEVPGQIDGGKVGGCAHGNAVGKQEFDVINDTTFILLLVVFKLLALFQLSLQSPSIEGHNKQCEEYHTRTEDLNRLCGRVSTNHSVSHRLHDTI